MSQYVALQVNTAFAGYASGAIITDPGIIDAVLASASASKVQGLMVIPVVSPATVGGTSLVTNIATATPVAIPNTSNTMTVVKLATPGAATVNLPPTPALNDSHTVKDGVGNNASTYPITLNGNGNQIDGSSTAVINVTGGALTFVWDGTTWDVT